MSGTAGLLPIAFAATAAMLSLAVGLAFFRLVLGPRLADRVVALDLIGIQTVAIAAAYGAATGESVLLDAAIVLALLGFLATVAFARYMEKTRA